MESPALLLTAAFMRDAEQRAIAKGATARAMMELAGKTLAHHIIAHYRPVPVAVMCGAGNNGGDGFVAARILRERGWAVRLCLAGDISALPPDALSAAHAWLPAHHAENWDEAYGTLERASPACLEGACIIIDALLGTGLSRAPEGIIAEMIEAANASGATIVAADIPSGVRADSGETPGVAIRAASTVTFHCAKPGHYLLPGRMFAGKLEVASIGIAKTTAEDTPLALNTPTLWGAHFPFPAPESHKYTRGHALIRGGGAESSGAARLAALAALRVAGLSSIACDIAALPVYAASLLSVMTKPLEHSDTLKSLAEDKRITALLIGPGAGATAATKRETRILLSTGKPIVLDADALTAFAREPEALFSAVHGACVLTPHMGEFSRLFNMQADKLTLALEGARMCGGIVVLKGADTIIAAPDGRAAINANAPAWLATAGAGDVLSGIIAGLLANGMPPFEAACAGVWLHGEAANHGGLGLIAEELPPLLKPALQGLYKRMHM